MPKRANKAKKKGQRKPPAGFTYTGPPLPDDVRQKLKDALTLPPPRPELDRSVLSKFEHPAAASVATSALSDQPKHGGGRPSSFTPNKKFRLERQHRGYKKKHPGALQKDVLQHLQNWAKEKLGITVSHGTILTHIINPAKARKNKN